MTECKGQAPLAPRRRDRFGAVTVFHCASVHTLNALRTETRLWGDWRILPPGRTPLVALYQCRHAPTLSLCSQRPHASSVQMIPSFTCYNFPHDPSVYVLPVSTFYQCPHAPSINMLSVSTIYQCPHALSVHILPVSTCYQCSVLTCSKCTYATSVHKLPAPHSSMIQMLAVSTSCNRTLQHGRVAGKPATQAAQRKQGQVFCDPH